MIDQGPDIGVDGIDDSGIGRKGVPLAEPLLCPVCLAVKTSGC